MGVQMALDRLARAIGSASGALTFLNNGVVIGPRSQADFRDGFEVNDANPTAEINYPAQMTTAARSAWSPRAGTIVFDTDLATLFNYNGTNWVET